MMHDFALGEERGLRHGKTNNKLIADLHIHTNACGHATPTIEEAAAAAKQKGLSIIAITEHGPDVHDAPPLEYFVDISQNYPREIDGVTVLGGIELNMMPNGYDLPDDILAQLDFVLCSQHQWCYPPSDDREVVTADWIKACEHPHIDGIAHVGQSDYNIGYDAIVRACVRTDTVLEVNNTSLRFGRESRETFEHWLKLCAKYDCPVIVNSDAHDARFVGNVDLAMDLLQEIGFPEDLVLNTNETRFRAWLARRRRNI
ncbi:MAG: PHP domain-containing protein [Oscillospiraceae bacterium]|nr:PHP domain-containing protein [Oscillospiraceae bacterium]